MTVHTLAEMTQDEFQEMLETIVEQTVERKLLELLGDLDEELTLRRDELHLAVLSTEPLSNAVRDEHVVLDEMGVGVVSHAEVGRQLANVLARPHHSDLLLRLDPVSLLQSAGGEKRLEVLPRLSVVAGDRQAEPSTTIPAPNLLRRHLVPDA